MPNQNFKMESGGFDKLHHANFVWGGVSEIQELKEILGRAGFVVKANPDFLEMNSNTFGIDEARELSRWAINKPIAGVRKVAIIIADSITHEAQNALLKVFEEPTLGTYFFVILPSGGGLLGTVLSRVRVYEGIGDTVSTVKNNFLKLPLAEKMNFIKKLSAEKDKDSLREAIWTLPEEASVPRNYRLLKKVLIAKRLVSARGSSPKMLLEWLASSI